MKTRTDLLNHLTRRHGLTRYLEIGVQNPSQNFDLIECEYRIGVDPDPNANAAFCMTSDEFFESYPYKSSSVPFDLIFLDGLHTAEQVKKDFYNSLKILSPGGFIVMHDCNPEKEEHTIVPRPTERGHWNGDVYKFAIGFKLHITVDIDNGCTIIRKGNIFWERNDVTWEYFDANRKELLNLITWDEFVKL